MSVGGNGFITSGTRGATFGAMGFFSASALSLGATATVGTLGTAAAAGFAGGLAMYCPAVALRLLMHHYGYFNNANRTLVAALDLALFTFTLPVGAWALGLAVQPFITAAAVALTLYTIFNCLHAVLKMHQISHHQSVTNRQNTDRGLFPRIMTDAFANTQTLDESTTLSPIGAFC